MQDMSGGGYSSNVYPNDKVVGILIMVFAAVCNLIMGALALLGGGLLASGAVSANTAGAPNGAAVAGAAGAVAMVAGVIFLIMGAVGIAVGYGVMKSFKWGFLVGSIIYGLGTLNGLRSLASGGPIGIIIFLIIAALFVYCLMRLIGKLGPKPV